MLTLLLCVARVVEPKILHYSSSMVDQSCLDPQSTCCQELGGVVQVFRRSPQLVGDGLIQQQYGGCLLQPLGTVLVDVVDHLFCFFAITECQVHNAM